MRRLTIGLGWALLVAAALLVACQRNAPPRPSLVPTNQPIAQSSPQATPPTPTTTSTPTLAPTATPTSTPTVTSTPTKTPTPTPTPIPSARLAAAQQAFDWGDYRRAWDEFAALLADPGADQAEIQLAAYWVGRSALEAGDYAAALEALQDFLRSYPDDPRAVSVQLLMARAYEGLQDWLAAIPAYQAYLRAGDDTLDIYAYQGMGDAAMLALDYDQAAKAYADGLRIAPDSGWAVAMREGMAKSALARGNPGAAVEQYDAILSVARIPAYRARILYLAGQALVTAGDQEAAHQRYLQAVQRYPEAYDSYLALVELVNAGVPVDDYQRGLVDYHAEAYQPAIDAFTRYLKANPKTRQGEAHWYLALALKANGNLRQAIQRFQELIANFPQNEHAAEAWLEMAEAYAWREDVGRAIQTYRDLAEEEPQSPLAATALWEAAALERNGGDLEQAAGSLRDLAARYPAANQAPDALFQAGLLDYRRADLETARKTWQQLVQDYPDSQAGLSGRYWLGKVWLALEKPDQAQAAFKATYQWSPTSYYGLRAAEMLADPPTLEGQSDPLALDDLAGEQMAAEDWLAGWLPITHTLALGELDPAIATDPAWRRGDALLAVGRRADALDEFTTVQDTWWDDPLAMYQLALAFQKRGAYRLSIISAERLIRLSPVASRLEAPLFIQRLSYPVYYQELVASQAQDQALDPLLLFALIRQESLFEPSITSPADARGLTQVIPATGEWIAGRLDWGELGEKDLWLPYVNINFGAFYLGLQLAAFEGLLIPALAAYNAGPGHIHEWLAEAPDVDLFVETMPFAEPRRYVRSVYENYAHYRRLYQDF